MLGNTNITTTLVGNELGSSSRNVRELCTNSNINMWSRWKPIQSPNIGGIDETILTQNRYGVSYASFVSMNSAPTYFDNNMNGWSYTRPTSIFRLGDFRNYKHNAVQILTSVKLPTSGMNVDTTDTVGASAFLNVNAGDINAKDLFPNGIYFGMIIKSGTTERYGTGTILQGTSSGAATVLVNTYALPNGIYSVYPVFCTQPYENKIYPSPNPPTSQQFIPIPNASVGTLTIRSADMTITLRASRDKAGLLTWSCIINSEISRTLTNNTVAFRFTSKDFNDPLTAGESQKPLQDIYVQSGVPYTLNGSDYVLQPTKNYKVWVAFQSATYKASAVALTPMG